MKALRFPHDELPHNVAGEWWYINGHLTDKYNKQYAFMYCIFHVNPKKSSLPILEYLPVESIYFPHAVLTNVSQKSCERQISYLALHTQPPRAKLLSLSCSLPLKPLQAPQRLDELEPFHYVVQTDKMHLQLLSEKPPLLVGGTGIMKYQGKSSCYYSIPRLYVSGNIQWNNNLIPVQGIAWMDHQWAEARFVDFDWTWFSLQLDNKTDILLARFKDNEKFKNSASVSFPDNTQVHNKKFTLEPVGTAWTSPNTSATYQLTWHIKIPAIKLDVTVTPKVKQQEMIFGKMNYWEGPLQVCGTMAGKPVTGDGFLELVGRHAKYNNLKFIKELLTQAL
ncbi:MAG: lipocalin family protein [Patescibacteria group bacterium]